MEVWSAASAAGAALLALALAWRLSRARGLRDLVRLLPWILGAAAAACGGLHWVRDPGLRAALLFGCCVGVAYGRPAETLRPQGRAVLLTGCDSGFGHALALQLSRRGLKVFAGVLQADGGGARRLREHASENLQLLQLDVTDEAQVEAAHRYICAQVADTGLWGLVNNAGVLLCPADAELQPLPDYRRCLEVNFVGVVRMCQRFLPLLRRSRGRIVNVSSLAGEVPMPMFAAYGASKAALSVFSEVLQQEMSAWGVHVCVIQPAAFRTGIFGDSGSGGRHATRLLAAASAEAREDYGEAYISSLPPALSQMSRLSAADLTPVIDDMLHALLAARPRPLYAPGRMAWLLPFLHRCCPARLFHAILACLPRLSRCQPAARRTLTQAPR